MIRDALGVAVLAALCIVFAWAIITPDPCFYGPGC